MDRQAVELKSFDAPEDGVAFLLFAIERTQDHVTITAHMVPDDNVVDGDEGDFPQFDATVSVEEYRMLRELFVRFTA
jgi:hypothetical protein